MTTEQNTITKKSKKTSVKQEGKSKKVSKMASLLENAPVPVIKEGEKLSGKIIDITNYAAFVDLGSVGTGIIYGKEVKDGFGLSRKKLGIGDEISAVVVDVENEEGYVELSITEAIREEVWRDLVEKQENKEPIPVRILGANKGGLMVEINGVRGFMPVSQLTPEHYPRVEDGDKNKILEILKGFVDTEMTVCVLVADESEDKLIVSEKEAYKDKEKEFVAEFKVGDIVDGEVSGVVDFGAFVKFLPPSKLETGKEEDKLEGLVHISQLDWQLIENPREVVKVGDKVKAKIISIDGTRISLSIRELKNDPWMSVEEKYKVGEEYKGRISKINHFGAFVYLDEDIHGLAHVSSFPGYPNKNIDEVVELDKEYFWKIMSMDPNSHRMGLKFVGSKPSQKKDDQTTKTGGEDSKKENKESEKQEKGEVTVDNKEKDKNETKESIKTEKKEVVRETTEGEKKDDLTKIEGIGPKIAETLTAGGIDSFAKLADAKLEEIQEIIKDVRGNHDAGTWSKQAALARDEKWEELTKLQDELDGGVAK